MNICLTTLHNFISENYESLNTYWGNEKVTLQDCLNVILEIQDKLSRRNMQIKDLKDKIESLKKAYLGELSNGDYKPSDECMADIGRLLGFNI